ncbi:MULTISPECIES: DUF6343 family protein [Streptomyces]|uniref:DUF6343 family protein n=1 Tax=Streptomyces sanyensis TaxID=568869 RepID=A0ABP9ASU9_9ACTN
MRSGNEPVNARSPLRLRLGLGIWGLVFFGGAAAAFALADHPGWSALCAALFLVAAVDVGLVVRRIRQGPHYQPGRDVPPYEPDHG